MGKGQIYSQFMYGTETTYGTSVTRNTVHSRIQSYDPFERNNNIYERGCGEGMNSVKSYYGPYDCGATVNFNVNDFDFLKHWIGPKTGSGTAGSPYLLTEATEPLMNSANSIYSFSYEAANTSDATDDVLLFGGCVGNDFTFNGEVDGILSCSANFFGQKSLSVSSATSYTPSAVSSFVMINGSWKWGSTPSVISGVRRFSMTYTNGMTASDYRDINNRFISRPTLPGNRLYSGTLTVATSTTLAQSIRADFYGQVATSGPEDGSTSVETKANLEFEIDFISGSKYAVIALDACSIDDISEPSAIGNGLVLMTFNFTAREAKSNIPIKWWDV